MNKQELTERIESLLDSIHELQSVAWEINEDMSDQQKQKWIDIFNCLLNADSAIDEAANELLEASNLANDIDEFQYNTTYKKMVMHIPNMVLCNEVAALENLYLNDQHHTNDEVPNEVFQWYLTDCSESDAEWLAENYTRVHFFFSEKLELWVLAVTHWGTAWDYVTIETKNEYDECKEGDQ